MRLVIARGTRARKEEEDIMLLRETSTEVQCQDSIFVANFGPIFFVLSPAKPYSVPTKQDRKTLSVPKPSPSQNNHAQPSRQKRIDRRRRRMASHLLDPLPQSVDSEYNQAVQFHKHHDPEHAEEHFRAVLKRKPNHVQTLLGLGSLLLEQGKREEADIYMKKATGYIMSPPKLPGENL
eukprot:1310278-Rhodomonas_salina.1